MNDGMTTQPNNLQPPDIKMLLKSKGRSMGFAAKVCGVSRNSMTAIAKRECLPRLSTAMKLSELVETPLTELYPDIRIANS